MLGCQLLHESSCELYKEDLLHTCTVVSTIVFMYSLILCLDFLDLYTAAEGNREGISHHLCKPFHEPSCPISAHDNSVYLLHWQRFSKNGSNAMQG